MNEIQIHNTKATEGILQKYQELKNDIMEYCLDKIEKAQETNVEMSVEDVDNMYSKIEDITEFHYQAKHYLDISESFLEKAVHI